MPLPHFGSHCADFLRPDPLVVVGAQNLVVELLVLVGLVRHDPLVVVGAQNLVVELLVLAELVLCPIAPRCHLDVHALPENHVLALEPHSSLVVVGAENLAVELVVVQAHVLRAARLL